MGKRNDRWLDIATDLIARFLVGSGAALAFILFFLRFTLRHHEWGWTPLLGGAGAVGIFFALFGLRKGPGAI